MNTFLTALLVDLLDPLAATGGLGDSVQRARRHLTAQIEAGGLVRYHGLPDAPGIGTLGCAITPDTDDTALVWRLAPDPDRRRLPAALATIDALSHPRGPLPHLARAARGLPVPRPGQRSEPRRHRDPDAPAAAAGQGAAAGRPRALRRAPPGDRPGSDLGLLRMAPLVPILRLTDLQRAGCELSLPASRMRTTVPGQEIWVSAVRLLASGPPEARADAAEIQAVLRQLANDDFALLAKESAAPLSQRSHRDGPQVLLVGGRRLRALATACP